MLAFLAPLRLRRTWQQQWLSMQPRAISPRVATRFVAFGTLALSIAAICYIVRFAANMPNTDEWDFANVVAGMPSLT